MDEKSNLVINQLANNFANKVAQLEGEKAILQIELKLSQQQVSELEQEKEETGKGDK
ncbi:hypothetical protein DFR54_102373 [Vagococcus fluvialis]|uniref:hypothetical protein n=1 Tax=Vagococcus fluvialis TaxID=2738 RepID=UPI000DFEE4FD|nr:hypothetical protein [Vagococcus fluvialis]RCX15310.1 hypothetical protein DFR54_102373 [Vagococcus fluvialis]